MQVVLFEDVKALGKKGDVVKVNDGYARNFIFPKKLGVEATPQNLAKLKQQKAYEAKVALSSWLPRRSCRCDARRPLP